MIVVAGVLAAIGIICIVLAVQALAEMSSAPYEPEDGEAFDE